MRTSSSPHGSFTQYGYEDAEVYDHAGVDSDDLDAGIEAEAGGVTVGRFFGDPDKVQLSVWGQDRDRPILADVMFEPEVARYVAEQLIEAADGAEPRPLRQERA